MGWMFGYFVWFSWSLGLEFCLVWCPLGPDPCQPRCLFVLSLSLVVWSGRRRRSLSFFLSFSFSFSLSLSLPQALGKPKPLLGFGFPLVFSSWSSPVPALFFLVVVVARWYGGGRLCSCSVFFSVCGGGLLFLVCLGCVGPLSPVCFCMQEYNAQFCFGQGVEELPFLTPSL